MTEDEAAVEQLIDTLMDCAENANFPGSNRHARKDQLATITNYLIRPHLHAVMRAAGKFYGTDENYLFAAREDDRFEVRAGAGSHTVCDVMPCRRIGKFETSLGRICSPAAHSSQFHLLITALYKLLNLTAGGTPLKVIASGESWKRALEGISSAGQFDTSVHGLPISLVQKEGVISYRISMADDWTPLCHMAWCLSPALAINPKCRAHYSKSAYT